MGGKIPGPHRCFTMRNPFARALVLGLGLFVLCAMMARSDRLDVRTTIVRTGTFPKNAIPAPQRPPAQQAAWVQQLATPTEEHDGKETASVGQAFLNVSHYMACDYNMEQLRKWKIKFGFEEKFEYTKRYVRAERLDIPRKSITNLRQNFLPERVKSLNVSKKYKPGVCPEPLTVPVSRSPFPSMANLSDFMFGVSTTYKRFSDPRTSPVNDWTFWLTNGKGASNGGKLVLTLTDASDEELENAADELFDAGIDADVFRSDANMLMAVRYLALVPLMYNHPEREGKRMRGQGWSKMRKKWLVLADDDTFFPAPHELAQRFRAYNEEQPMYVGTFSEDVNNIARHGSQAFGGGGVFLSVPTAQQITEDYDSCKTDDKVREANSGWGPQGDILLRKCIDENSETKLTLLNDLWQLDMYGDPSGFYESGIKPLSLHHYRGGGWHVAHPWHYTKVASICGEDCTLQRFQTADDFIISNGFSVAYYPEGIDFDVNQVERTFHPAPEDKEWNFDFAFGPQRQSLHESGRKISWDLQEANIQEDGSVSQIYVRKHSDWRWKNSDGSEMSEMDGIIELVWLPMH
ncbi:glycosyltransferase family 31 protein [Cercophora newfieldiana]|uniref:Glycosyltransferase family 31 protein n=1 Tax=Cercophora newfieldiana TaxID=92897 RepID=A0AA39Y9R4_9PEZI|nr:glycosyltransferase family 31 protein [Cercophora newfieldiana]